MERIPDNAVIAQEVGEPVYYKWYVDSLRERIAVLEDAVNTAKAQFQNYANQHYEKNTPESRIKGDVNEDLAADMHRALRGEP